MVYTDNMHAFLYKCFILPLEYEEFSVLFFFFTQRDLMHVTVEMLTLTINNKVTTPKAIIHSLE